MVAQKLAETAELDFTLVLQAEAERLLGNLLELAVRIFAWKH